MQDANVKVRFFTRVVEADADPATRTVRGIITSNVEGMKYIKADAFIDCTGDAVLTDLCGADSRPFAKKKFADRRCPECTAAAITYEPAPQVRSVDLLDSVSFSN